ncbi:MAG: hypothetical protein NZ960_00440 [Candidatus Kapabacteria bacterium]|nr:hypothetical protein [Candidatus Kapabacteria bacterium]MDW8011495.1 hypothetical protein [Bacteroidota bacterium]
MSQSLERTETHLGLWTLFLRALEYAAGVARGKLPTVAQLRVEIPYHGHLLLVIAVEQGGIHVQAETASPELAWQFSLAAEELQRLFSERRLHLRELVVQTPSEFSNSRKDTSRDDRRQDTNCQEGFRERSRFIRSFGWRQTEYVG